MDDEGRLEISVVIPCHNAERYVAEAVGSALAQPETVEVLLVEDGSSDGSLDECERVSKTEQRVRLLRHPGGENQGAAAARNTGVRHCRSEYLAFLDADDYYLPGRFAADRRVLAENPTLDGVYDAVGVSFESPGVEEWWQARQRRPVTTLSRAVAPEELFENLMHAQNGVFHTNGILVRRELFDRTGLFDESLRMAQDFAMWLKMAAVARLGAGRLDRPVAMRRLHGDNRMIRQEYEHRRYVYLMWASLARWAKQERLPRERRHMLELAQLGAWVRLDAAQRESVSGYKSQLRFLIGLACRHPQTLHSGRFWRQTARALGGSHLRHLARSRPDGGTPPAA